MNQSESTDNKTENRNMGKAEGESGSAAWAEQKAAARQRKKLEKAVCDAEQTISELEQAIAILEAQMNTPEGGSNMEIYERHGRLKQQLARAEDEWTQAMEALEG